MDLLSDLLDRAAERWPDKDVFRFAPRSLSYGQASLRGNQLARCLMERGVAKGDRVGIYLDKGLESALSLYGIMKAGAAYVPLDPAAPIARLEYMINHCGIGVVISAGNKAAQLAQLHERCPSLHTVIGLTTTPAPGLAAVSWDEVFSQNHSRPAVSQSSGDLAYIMFTSGSTGTPKGMMHTHSSGLGYAKAARDLYQVGPDDRLGNHSPLHFDMSTFEYFSGPLAGATTVIIPEAYTRLPASLSQLMEKERLSFWYSVPFALIQLLLRGVLDKRDLSSLRWVMFGGEPFPPKYLQALMACWPQARFSNVYGPAEVNQCTYYHLPQAPSEEDEAIPIGVVWDAAEGLVLDGDDQPIPATAVGSAGELVIRGNTMMQGYWNRPDLNQKAFYQAAAGGAYYRTGDLVRWRNDGYLDFLGRKDRLVKIRGYRLELDEVELALGSHGAVEEAAAFVTGDAADAPELEAAVILKPGLQAEADILRQFVSERMPPYGVPARVHVLERFPRTTSGKIDRRALKEQFSIGQAA